MNSFFKVSIFALLVMLTVSIGFSVEVTDDTNDITIPTTETIEENTEVLDTSCDCDVNIPTQNFNTAQTQYITPNDDITQVNDSTTYDLSGTFTNKTLNYENINNVVFTSTNNDATFINSTITISGENITISNLKFDNTNTDGNPLTITDSSNVFVLNNEFDVYKNTQQETYSVNVIDSDNVVVADNQIDMTGSPQGVNWVAGGLVEFSAIVFSNVDYSYIDSNTLNLVNSTQAIMWDYSTMETITVRSQSQNNLISRNKINITGSDYIYGISTSENSKNITICKNNITMNGTNLVSGIQLSSTNDSKVCSNKINGTCTAESGTTTSAEAFAYGVAVLTYTWHPEASEAAGNIICNNDVTLNSTVAYAYELSIADNTLIYNNTANVTGRVVMALGIYNSSYCNIIGNTFTVTGDTRDLNQGIYEAIPPETTGIKIVDYSSNVLIDNNSIIVIDTTNNNNTFCVILEECCDSIDVTNNVLYLSNPLIRQGDNSIRDVTGMQYIYNNN